MTMNNTTEKDDDAKARKKLYKKSLNLPKTSFPMRANLHQNEPQSIQRWNRLELYERVREARAGSPPFVFHDGPPYANGTIHVGHLLNRVLKDLVVRTRTLAGQDCPFVPGWDCHGLPIEHRVMTEMVESGKFEKLATLEADTRRMAVRRECARYAGKYKKLQAKGMESLMTLADYDHPYLTMTRDYEQKVLEVLAELIAQGIVYRALKPVHWSIANETALAEAELEYRDREDPSIYVWFEAAEPAKLAAAFGVSPDSLQSDDGSKPVSLMIWTTTPWTLPANLLIAVHPRLEYSLVRLDGRLGVLATERTQAVAATTGAEIETLATAKGERLVGHGYLHPFRATEEAPPRAFRVVAADYVTLEDGTGLVHTAPGHGAEDYGTGIQEGMPIYCPVRADGTYDQTVAEWLRGESIWSANDQILETLEHSGHLYHHQRFVHSYPHDWRSKTPVIFRGTEQWFVAVDRPMADSQKTIRQLGLEAAQDQILFLPPWGQKRLLGMVESRPDWCLSRQRAWGLAIPAFRTASGEIFLTAASVRAVAEAFGERGGDAWFTESPQELLAGYDPQADPDAPTDLDLSALVKLYDILDVWFESGSSWNAVMRARDLGYPTDLYLEGSDQHRGWFQSSLLTAIGVTGQAPYKALLTHGFIVDKDGRKMSKSGGNALEVEDLLRDFGADVCRWWVSSLAFENDIKVDLEFFELAGESYRKVRNTLRFLLSNLSDFDPQAAIPPSDLDATTLDAWALERTAELGRRVTGAYEQFAFRQAHNLLFDFCNETMSSLYLDAVKDRLYCDAHDSPRRLATQSVLYEMTLALTTLLAPLLPHTADEAYRALLGASGDETVHLVTFHPVEASADPGWATVMEARGRVLKALEQRRSKGLENPLDAGVVVPDPEGSLRPFVADIADVFGVSRVELSPTATEVEVVDLRDQPRCERSWRRDDTVAQRSDGGWLSDRDARVVGVA